MRPLKNPIHRGDPIEAKLTDQDGVERIINGTITDYSFGVNGEHGLSVEIVFRSNNWKDQDDDWVIVCPAQLGVLK